MKRTASVYQSLLLSFLLIFTSGCGLLIGNVNPIDEKSNSYHIFDISKESKDWVKLEGSTSEGPDVAFQSKKSASIISLNSACRPSFATTHKDLSSFTSLLILGISDIVARTEKNLTLQNNPALETTIEGKLNGEPVTLQTVVTKIGNCLYDVTLVSRPSHFAQDSETFAHFVTSLKLR